MAKVICTKEFCEDVMVTHSQTFKEFGLELINQKPTKHELYEFDVKGLEHFDGYVEFEFIKCVNGKITLNNIIESEYSE